MGSGFIRRYPNFPGAEVITQIEGSVIIDLPPPGQVAGVGTGTVGLVAEFADVSHGVQFTPSDGSFATKPRPVEVFSAQDLQNKVGGFDPTLGEFGGADGNGFVALRNKKFSRLIVVPVNLASPEGGREYRELPTCKAADDPTSIVPMVAASVPAGTEFKNGSDRVRSMRAVTFSSAAPFVTGVDGVTASGTGTSANFTSAGSDFLASGVKKGDALVFGVIGTTTGAGTYRVVSVTDANTLVIEAQSGGSFTVGTVTTIPFRVHPGSAADSAPLYQSSEIGSYDVPCRPLDDDIPASTECAPTVAVAAGTATSWLPLSGLKLLSNNDDGIVYDADVQAPNAVNSTALDALYQACLDSLLGQEEPANQVNLGWCARTSEIIRSSLKQFALSASAQGLGHSVVLAPELDTLDESTVLGSSSPGVGTTRDERADYSWPGARTLIPEAIGYSLGTADGGTTDDGILDVRMDGYLVSIMSVLAPERNPGEATPTTAAVLGSILGLQRGVSGLTMNDYILFRQYGIAALRMDQTVGPIIQSGITSSLVAGQKNINRRRMADFIEDSLSQAYMPFVKQPLTNQLKDAVAGETVAFLDGLLSPNNAAAQRIAGYTVDTKSGNTPELEEQGIYIIIVHVRTLATADFIVLQAEIGEGVNITQLAA